MKTLNKPDQSGSILYLPTPMNTLPNSLCFIDIETTGTSLRGDRIIEIGALRIENNTLVDSFKTLINPGRYLPPEISVLTGINSADLEGAPSFFDIKDRLMELIEGTFFVAHNVRFDYGFIKNEFRMLGYPFSAKQICTVKLSRSLFPQYPRHNLDSIIERFGFKVKNRHRAFDDAEVLWKFYEKTLKQFSEAEILLALNKTVKRPSLPVKLSEESLEDLPEGPGVYIFYGENGCPLYIGKSINIRERVLSHFVADTTSSKEMKISQQIESIETVQTEGELGALIKESFLIKKMQPLYNRKLRNSRQLLILKYTTNSQGYHTATFGVQNGIDEAELESIIGVFRSKKSVNDFLIHFGKQFMLCEKLLGIDHSAGTCFGYRLGKCKGACHGKEKPLMYNLRFMEAFSIHKFKKWPFEGPVIIEDVSGDGGSKDRFVVNNWCIMGLLNPETSEVETYSDVGFDLDTYKILSTFIFKNSSQKYIRPLRPEMKQQSTPEYEPYSESV